MTNKNILIITSYLYTRSFGVKTLRNYQFKVKKLTKALSKASNKTIDQNQKEQTNKSLFRNCRSITKISS